MASNQWTVNVPDRSTMFFSKNLTPDEVKGALVSSGITSVENATYTVSADGSAITFNRVQGGSKGN